jgi:protein AbiQ
MKFLDFSFYNIDERYLKTLHSADNKSQYSHDKDYGSKPFLGIVEHESYRYFIPLSSGKAKHARMNYIGKDYILIYEVINIASRRPHDIVKPRRDAYLDKILSVLNINNMIPVPEGLYRSAAIQGNDLLRKEYEFCFDYKDDIITKANVVYDITADSKAIERCCNFNKLEEICTKYMKQDK